MVTGGDLSQWKHESLQGQPITYGLWSRRYPPSFHLDPNNPTQTRVSPGATTLSANEGVDFGPWAGIRLHGSAGRTAAAATGCSWRLSTAARATRSFLGALTVGRAGRGRAESGQRERRKLQSD